VALRVVSIVAVPGIDTSTATGFVSCNRSPAGPNAHEMGMVIGQVLDLSISGDITQQFALVQDWQDTTEKVVTYGLLQKPGFNNSGKQLLAIFMAP